MVILSGTAAEEQVDLSGFGAEAFIAKRRFPEMMSNLVEVLRGFEGKNEPPGSTEVIGGDALAPRELVRELLDVKRHYDTLIDMVEDGVVEIDREERVLFINRSALRYLEILEGDLIGRPPSELFPEVGRGEFQRLLAKISAEPGATGSLILEMPQKTLKLKVVPLWTDGSYDGALITLQDVTAELRKVEGLEQINKKIIGNVPVGILLVSDNGFIKALNPVMAAWLGSVGAEDLVGTNLLEYRRDPGRRIAEAIGRMMGKSGLQSGEVMVRQGDGDRTYRLVVSQDFAVGDGRNGRIVVVEDETERLLLRSKLEKINEELLVANQTKSNFISMISHELRTPLTIVEGYLSLLLEDSFGPLSPKVREPLEITKEKSDHLRRLIEDLLDISRIETGQFLVRMERVDLEEIVAQAIVGVRDRAASRGITIERNLPATAVSLLSEKSKVYQVIVNLLGNAVKFSDSGGRVSLSVQLPGTPRRELPAGWRTIVAGGRT